MHRVDGNRDNSAVSNPRSERRLQLIDQP